MPEVGMREVSFDMFEDPSGRHGKGDRHGYCLLSASQSGEYQPNNHHQ